MVAAGIAASPQDLLASLEDHRRLAARMKKPSPMMAGATVKKPTASRARPSAHGYAWQGGFCELRQALKRCAVYLDSCVTRMVRDPPNVF